MKMRKFLRVVIVFCVLVIDSFQQQSQGPCPGLFQYASDGYENYGLIYFSGAQIGRTYLLDLQLIVQGRLPTVRKKVSRTNSCN